MYWLGCLTSIGHQSSNVVKHTGDCEYGGNDSHALLEGPSFLCDKDTRHMGMEFPMWWVVVELFEVLNAETVMRRLFHMHT